LLVDQLFAYAHVALCYMLLAVRDVILCVSLWVVRHSVCSTSFPFHGDTDNCRDICTWSCVDISDNVYFIFMLFMLILMCHDVRSADCALIYIILI